MSASHLEEVLAIIPAKGHSRGVPGKNKRMMHGKPLFLWSVQQGRRSRFVDYTCVSSDDPEILQLTAKVGAWPIKRPPGLTQDDTTTEAVIEDVAQQLALKAALIVILPPTNPCRTYGDIDRGVADLLEHGWDSSLSVVLNYRFLWIDGDGIGPKSINYDWQHRHNREDLPPQYMENGCIYISRYQRGFPNRLHGLIGLQVMDYWSSFEIDTENDWKLVEFAMQQKGLVSDSV